MGQFSWLYSDTNKQMLDDHCHPSYLLVPEEFQKEYGKFIKEDCYDGYGHFGDYDVYDLVALWNREEIPRIIELAKKGEWICGMFVKEEILMEFFKTTNKKPSACALREIGIMMACYDEDNARLRYPIKIVENPCAYSSADPSEADPNQGWLGGDVQW